MPGWDRFVHSRPGRRFQGRYRRKRQAKGSVWKRGALVCMGIALALAGMFFMAVPGPGIPILAIGLALIAGGLDSRPWTSLLAATGLFYGLFGALRLGVTIDIVLLLGALLALVVAFMPKASAKKVSLKGMLTCPPADNASKRLRASALSFAG